MKPYTLARIGLGLVALAAMYHRLAPDIGPVMAAVAASAIAIGLYYLTEEPR